MHYPDLQQVTGRRISFLLLFNLFLFINNVAWSQAPSGFSYPTPVSYYANVTNVYMSPTVSGIVTSYSLSNFAVLPAGLAFDGNTGIISGIATEALVTTVYTVTATNSFGSATTNFTMTVINNYLDNANKQIHLGGTGVVITHPNGSVTGQLAGDVTLYQNVATISGYVIDCYITTKAVVNIYQWLAYDQNEESGDAFNSNKPDYFSPQVVFHPGGGSVTYELQYIFSGTYNSITKSGANVTLQNVVLNTYDIDGNSNPGALQYNEFNGFNTSELGTNPSVAATYNATSNLTKFRSTSINNIGNITAAATRVRVTYLNMSGFSIVVGSEGSGNAFFFLDFSAGSVFTSVTTTSPSVDLNKSIVGVANEEAACNTALSFTRLSQTNITASNNLVELDISYLRADIKDGANEQLVINGTTSGVGIHPLSFSSASVDSLEIGGVVFHYAKSVTTVSGIITNKIAFTKTNGGITFTDAQAETLLDALHYTDVSGVPTAGDRRFTVNVLNSTFKSPNAVFTATVNCVTIGGHVFRDQNGLSGTTDFNTISANSAVGQFSANAVYAVLVNPVNDQVIASQGIAAGGAYTFGTATPGSYILYTANALQEAGTVFTAATFPAGGYVSVGENLDANPGSDLLNDGKLALTVGSAPITNANFGLNIPPVAVSVTAPSQINPGGAQKVTVSTLSGTDPEQTSLHGGQGNGIRLTSLPVNGVLYYNNLIVNLENPVIGIYNPALLTVDLDDGALTFSFNYKQIDAAGTLSINEATLTMLFTNISITGKIYHDPNGITNGQLDGTLVSGLETKPLYVNLIERSTGFVSGSSTVINGSYTIGTADGLQANTNLDLLISTIRGIAGTITGAVPSIPVGWASSAEGGAAGDGTPDGLLQITTGIADISSGLDFGLQQLPNAGDGSIAFSNELGAENIIIPPNSFTSTSLSWDADGSIMGLRITYFPDEVMRFIIGGTSYNKTIAGEMNALLALTIPTDATGNPTVTIAIDPDSDNQPLAEISFLDIDIPFVAIDNSGASSSNMGHALLNISSPLPVTLISFIAVKEGSASLLNWSTSEETNSERFDIQHSANAKLWKTIGSVSSSGNTKVRQDYSFTHNNPIHAINYYRLKMIDRAAGTPDQNHFDATFAYSRIRSLEFTETFSATLYPNPVSEKLTINSADWKSVLSIEIFDVTGKIVFRKTGTDLNNQLNLNYLSTGIYFLKTGNKNKTADTYKFFVR